MTDELEPDYKCGAYFLARPRTYAVLLVVAVMAYVFLGCGAEPTAETLDTTPATVAVGPPPVPTTAHIEAAAVVQVPAVRIDPPETPAPFDAVAYVNGLDYGWTDMGPAMEAFRVVAWSRGWTRETTDRWAPFVYDVIVKESGGCWNTIGGDLYVIGTCHEYTRHGWGEDSSFGQATSSIWGRTGVSCVQLGVCSQKAMISSPWVGMLASVVVPIEHSGRFSWCDYKGAPKLHNCSLIGRNERPLP